MRCLRLVAFGVAFGFLVSPAAFAVHGTVGTWEITWKMGGTVGSTERFCMSLADVGSDLPPMSLTGHCRPVNTSMPGDTFASDLICGGAAPGRGTVFIRFSSPTHYSGHQSVTVKLDGRLITTDVEIDAHWVSARCTAQPMIRN